MRIGLVCPYDLSKPGGVQGQVKGLARALHTSTDPIIVIGPGLPDDLSGVDLGSTISIPGNGSMVPLSFDPRVMATIKEAADQVDLLHVHEPLMPLVSLAALRVGKPVVGTFHAAPGVVGAGFYRVIKSQVRRLLGPNTRKLTAVSRTAAAPLSDALEVAIVPNGIEVDAFSAGAKRVAGRVTFLGRDEPRKGLDVLLDAWDRVSAELPEAELVVMGGDRKTAAGVTWMGTVDDDTKAQVLSSSEVHVAPNRRGESFGVVLVEAMAAGCAVLASDLPSFRDVAGDAARYFRTGDSDDLALELIYLLRDAEARAMLASVGQHKATEYDWSAVSAAYRSVYQSALS